MCGGRIGRRREGLGACAGRGRNGSCALGDEVGGLSQPFERRLKQDLQALPLTSERLAGEARFVGGLNSMADIRARLGGGLDPLVQRKPFFDGAVVATGGFAYQVERQRLVGLGGGVLGARRCQRSSSVIGVTSPSARERWTAAWTAALAMRVWVRPVARLSAV